MHALNLRSLASFFCFLLLSSDGRSDHSEVNFWISERRPSQVLAMQRNKNESSAKDAWWNSAFDLFISTVSVFLFLFAILIYIFFLSLFPDINEKFVFSRSGEVNFIVNVLAIFYVLNYIFLYCSWRFMNYKNSFKTIYKMNIFVTAGGVLLVSSSFAERNWIWYFSLVFSIISSFAVIFFDWRSHIYSLSIGLIMIIFLYIAAATENVFI